MITILSQDRTFFGEVKNVVMLIGANKENHYIYSDGHLLGTYKTNERALKIIQEIKNLYIAQMKFKKTLISKSDIDNFITNAANLHETDLETELLRLLAIVAEPYEMPEE